jgi:CBS domain containing-hemolysin-like protein
MLVFMALARPAVRFLKGSAAIILRGFHIPLTERAQVHSPEELQLIASAARRLGVLPPYQEALIHRALELEDVPTREIMTPRQKIFSLPSNLAVEAATAQVIEHKRSRVPVYDETRGPEHIIGAVYSKDLARLMFFRSSKPVDNLTLRDVMRDILVVPETKSVLDLLRDLQQRRRPIAIVVDEYGSTVGLVTMEDAIEQLTGELEDEFDAPALPVLPTADGALLMDGGLNLRDLETEMQWDLPRKGGVETLAGFLLMRLGHIPKVGESITHEGRRLTVVEMDNRRIAKIRVEPMEEVPPLSDQGK